jgi:uncharacterized protein (DUF433 family)
MAAVSEIDWSECPLVDTNSRVQSGAPVLRGTRLPVSAVVDNYEYGLDAAEIAFQFQVSQESVESVLSYAQSHRVARPVR